MCPAHALQRALGGGMGGGLVSLGAVLDGGPYDLALLLCHVECV